jgi:hypothetical protein
LPDRGDHDAAIEVVTMGGMRTVAFSGTAAGRPPTTTCGCAYASSRVRDLDTAIAGCTSCWRARVFGSDQTACCASIAKRV